jgi:hypothetical protein
VRFRIGQDRTIVKKSVLLSALCVGVLTSNASAYDVSVKANLSETVETSNNYFLSNSPNGVTIRPLSAVNLDILAQTPTTQYLLDSYWSYFKYLGPGASDAAVSWGAPAHSTFSIDHTTPLDRFHFDVGWTRADVTQTLLAQTGNAGSSHGTVDTFTARGGVTHDFGRRDSVSWYTTAATSTSTDPGFTPYLDVTSIINWNHVISPLVSWNNSVSFDWFSADDVQSSQRLFWKVMTGVDARLTKRLSFNGHVGMGFVNAWQNNPGAVTPAIPVFPLSGITPFIPLVGAANSLLWDVGLSYDLLKTTKLSLTAAQTIFPTITGQLTKSELVALTVVYRINTKDTLSFLTQVSRSTSGNGPGGGEFAATGSTQQSEFFTAVLTYDTQLSRYWRGTASYAFRERHDTTGTATSSTILLGLSYDWNIYGNPSPVNVALRERARERAQNTVGYAFPLFH